MTPLPISCLAVLAFACGFLAASGRDAQEYHRGYAAGSRAVVGIFIEEMDRIKGQR